MTLEFLIISTKRYRSDFQASSPSFESLSVTFLFEQEFLLPKMSPVDPSKDESSIGITGLSGKCTDFFLLNCFDTFSPPSMFPITVFGRALA
jgi:hypothetical protein